MPLDLLTKLMKKQSLPPLQLLYIYLVAFGVDFPAIEQSPEYDCKRLSLLHRP